MSDQKLALDLGDLAVESIQMAPANSLDSASYGHGTLELAASCHCGSCATCMTMLDESDDE